MSKNISDILLEPIITEKSTAQANFNKYTFKVPIDATKSNVRKAFEEIFPGRKVLAVQALKIRGHKKRTKSGFTLQSDLKKMVVTASGARVEYFPEVGK